MKKVLFSMLAVGLLTACSNEELVDAPKGQPTDVPIAFAEAFVNKPVRAAQEVSNSTLGDFSVFGYQRITDDDAIPPITIFRNEVVSKSGSDWTYSNTQYWGSGKDYLFHAIAPYTQRNWEYVYDMTSMTKPQSEAYIKMTNTGEHDLIFATAIVYDVVPESQAEVNLEFTHLMSRVKFRFTNGMSNELTTLQVKDIKITNSYSVGIAQLNAATGTTPNLPTWRDITGSLETTFSQPDAIAKDVSKESSWQYLFPMTAKSYTLQFTVNVYQSGVLSSTFNHTVSLPSTDYEINHSYVFTATLNADNINPDGALKPIKFKVDAFDWEADTDIPVTLPEATP